MGKTLSDHVVSDLHFLHLYSISPDLAPFACSSSKRILSASGACPHALDSSTSR